LLTFTVFFWLKISNFSIFNHEFILEGDSLSITRGLFGLRGERGGVKGSKVELTENRLILSSIYSTSPSSPSIQTDHKVLGDNLNPHISICYSFEYSQLHARG